MGDEYIEFDEQHLCSPFKVPSQLIVGGPFLESAHEDLAASVPPINHGKSLKGQNQENALSF